MSKNIIRHLTNILIALVEESSAVPQGVMDVIIDQFTKHASVSRQSHSRTPLTPETRYALVHAHCGRL
jgi:uncharacterized membrane protein